jgi:predicted CopG family antitoxin
MAKRERKTISIKRDTQRMLWQLKETPDDTYDEIIRDLMSESCDIEVYSDE